jgi:transketolase
MAAAHYELTSLVAIVDNNGFQGDGMSSGIMDGGDLGHKWAGFGWSVRSVEGHDVVELYKALTEPGDHGKPKAILARTVKGKGVSFMENNNDWHHNRLTRLLYDRAVRDLEAAEA